MLALRSIAFALSFAWTRGFVRMIRKESGVFTFFWNFVWNFVWHFFDFGRPKLRTSLNSVVYISTNYIINHALYNVVYFHNFIYLFFFYSFVDAEFAFLSLFIYLNLRTDCTANDHWHFIRNFTINFLIACKHFSSQNKIITNSTK